jgi:hypothetical protein
LLKAGFIRGLPFCLAHLLDSTFSAVNLKSKQFPLLRWFLPQRSSTGKLLNPSKRRKLVLQVTKKLSVSERRACKVLEQARATQRRDPFPQSDEQNLTDDIVALATKYGRYGYRRITAL